MKRILKCACMLAAAVCLMATAALAELGWVDDQLSPFLDINKDTVFSAGIHLGVLQPFGDEIVTMLNETLDQIRVEARIVDGDSQMTVKVAGNPVFSLEESSRDGHLLLTTDLLPNRALMAKTSPMDILSGNEMAAEPLFDLHTAISEVEDCYRELADAIIPYATEKAANYKITGIGYSRWVRLARLTVQDSGTLLPQIIRVLGCGMDQAFREKLQTLTCADGFTVALYFDEENGQPLALYMKGSVYLAPEDKWTLAYQWAFTRGEDKWQDTYRYELEQGKTPRHKRVIEAKRTSPGTGEDAHFGHDSQLAVKDDNRNETIIRKDRLQLTHSGNQTHLNGTLVTTVKDHSGGETTTTVTTITPELTLTSAEGSGVLSGTVNLQEQKGKNTYQELTFILDEEPALALDAAAADGSLFAVDVDPTDPSVAGSSLAQNVDVIWGDDSLKGYLVGNPPIGMTAYPAPRNMQTVDLEMADEAQLAALLDEMAQRAAGLLLVELAQLPGEPLRLLTDGMTDVDYAAFLSLLGDL